MIRSLKSLLVVGGVGVSLLAMGVGAAQANVTPFLQAGSPTPEAGAFRWTYSADLDAIQQLRTNDFFTIYDFVGYVPGSITAPTQWAPSVQNVGITPVGLVIPDDTTIPNLTWTYTGPTVNGPLLFPTAGETGTFSALSIYGNKTIKDPGFGAQAGSTVPDLVGQTTMNKGPIVLPVVPEPCTLSLLGFGAVPMLGRLRRRSRKA